MAMLQTIMTTTSWTGSGTRCSSIAPQMAENAKPTMLESVAANKTADKTKADAGTPWLDNNVAYTVTSTAQPNAVKLAISRARDCPRQLYRMAAEARVY